MYIKTKAIVISASRYQEKSLIVKCFTEQYGLQSYYVRDAFSSKKSNQKNIYFRPLTILDIVSTHKNKGTLEYFKEVKLSYNYASVNDIVKTTIMLFLSEVLHNCIKEESENYSLYNFLETALVWLDTNDESSNFHLILLMELTKYLGFYPDLKNKDCPYFEMLDGVFKNEETLTCLTQGDTTLFKRLLSLKFDECKKAFHVSERQKLLKILIDYFQIHSEGFKTPKSLEVLKEIYS